MPFSSTEIEAGAVIRHHFAAGAYGSTKDYQHPKTNAMDNFANTSGPGFFLVEPGICAEVNISKRVRLGTGCAYRLAAGLDEDNTLISRTNVTARDLSGMYLLMSLKFVSGTKWHKIAAVNLLPGK